MALLAAVCRTALTGGEAGGETVAVPGPAQAPFAALAGRTRMWSACELGFRNAGWTPPPEFAAAMQAARGRAMIANGRVLGLARIAFPVLGREGIAALAFKGPFQHRQLLGDPFFCRANDLDLLVARDRFGDALAVLEANGFVRREETSPWWTRSLGEVHLRHRQGGVIDLHHRLQQPGCPPPRDLGQFLAAPAQERLGEVTISLPSRPQSLLICAINFAKEFAHRRLSARYAFAFAAGLLRLSDAEREEFGVLVRDQGLAGTVRLSIALCSVLFDLDLPNPLGRGEVPAWATRPALLAMVFDPGGQATLWPRRRTILWAMCGGVPGTSRAAEFAREAARMAAAEALRRASGGGRD